MRAARRGAGGGVFAGPRGRVRRAGWTADAGTTRGGIFIRHPTRWFRPVFVVSASRVRGWVPAGEERNPGKGGWGAATRREEEGKEGARGVDL